MDSNDIGFLDQTRQLAGVLESAEASEAGGRDLCEVYRQAKPILEFLLPFIERTPGFGKVVADAIRVLMKLADVACPV